MATITVIAKELRKDFSQDKNFIKDIDTLLDQAKKCGEILKKISQNQIIDDEYVTNITLQDLLFEITKSFEEITEKKINLDTSKINKKINIKRSPELTYGIRNFVGNAVKFSKNKIDINIIENKSEILIEISDDGPGFPDDILNVIGEPYISSKSKKLKSKSGLGLGTFIGKTLLERKKATLEFSNNNFGGALVQITWKNSDLISRS